MLARSLVVCFGCSATSQSRYARGAISEPVKTRRILRLWQMHTPGKHGTRAGWLSKRFVPAGHGISKAALVDARWVACTHAALSTVYYTALPHTARQPAHTHTPYVMALAPEGRHVSLELEPGVEGSPAPLRLPAFRDTVAVMQHRINAQRAQSAHTASPGHALCCQCRPRGRTESALRGEPVRHTSSHLPASCRAPSKVLVNSGASNQLHE